MSDAALLNYFAKAGHTVAEGAGAGWYDAATRFYMALPFEKPVDALAVQAGGFLPENALGARFVSREGQGRQSWALRCDHSGYDMQALSSNTRSKVRRGLASFKVGPISISKLADEGARLDAETRKRQNRSFSEAERKRWNLALAALEQTPQAEIWGAQIEGVLAAYAIALRSGNTSNITILRSGREFLPKYVNNALLYGYLEHALARDGLEYVSFGLEPLGRELPHLREFKESMGFRCVPLWQAVVLTPTLDRLLRSPAGVAIGFSAQFASRSEKLARLRSLATWVRKQQRLVFQGQGHGKA